MRREIVRSRVAWMTALIAILSAPAAIVAQLRRPIVEKACAANDAGACTELGELLEWGGQANVESLKPDPKAALPYYQKACDAGNASGCLRLGSLYARGQAVPKDTTRALQLWTRSCDAQEPGACFGLGDLSERGDGIARNPTRAADFTARALALVTASCDRGTAERCDWLAGIVSDGQYGVSKDPARSLALRERACTLGSSGACVTAAMSYRDNPAFKNEERAKALFARGQTLLEQQCDRGDVSACWSLNTPKANYKACDLGDPGGCWRLGVDYRPDNIGSADDVNRTIYFWQKGCGLGDASQCVRAAEIYEDGRLLRADPQAALRLYEQACAMKETEGCSRAAQLRQRKR